MRFAILDAQNVVTNIIEGDAADPGFSIAFPNAVELQPPGGLGSVYDPDAKTFGIQAAVPEPPNVWISAANFMLKFTTAERIAISASTDPVVADFMRVLNVSVEVDLKAPITVQGVNYIASIHLIAPERVSAILN